MNKQLLTAMLAATALTFTACSQAKDAANSAKDATVSAADKAGNAAKDAAAATKDAGGAMVDKADAMACLLYTSPSPRDATLSRMPSSA